MSTKWRLAFLDTREAMRYLDENQEESQRFFTVDRTVSMLAISTLLSLLLLGISVVWNLFPENPQITPLCFLIAETSLILCICLGFVISYVSVRTHIRNDRKKITAYQDEWPDIIDIAKEHENDLCMPEIEPRTREDLPLEWDGSIIEAEIDELPPPPQKPHEIPTTVEEMLRQIEMIRR